MQGRQNTPRAINSKFISMKYLITNPDRYGRFGHQTLSIYGSLLIAYITGNKVLHPSYMYLCEKWNCCVDWNKSKFSVNRISSKTDKISYLRFEEHSDQNGNMRIQLRNSNDVKLLIRSINSFDDNSIIFLPFDQSIGILDRLINRADIREDFTSLFSLPSSFQALTYRYACIHIRRGDCTQDRFPEWYVENSFYINLINSLLELLPSDYKIHICTQGDTAWIVNSLVDQSLIERIIVHSTSELFTNDREVSDFFIMQQSDILFTAGSTYSHMASWSGSHQILFDVSKGRNNSLVTSIPLSVNSE